MWCTLLITKDALRADKEFPFIKNGRSEVALMDRHIMHHSILYNFGLEVSPKEDFSGRKEAKEVAD